MGKLLRRWVLPLLLVALALLFVLSPDRSGGGGGAERPTGATWPGQTVPAFEARTLDGATIRFPADYRGKLVLLDFWATWCPPCRGEIPHLVAAYEKFRGRGFEIIGVTLDRGRASPAYVREFVKDQRMTWPQVYDDAAILAGEYRVSGIPMAFLVDGDTGRLLNAGGALRDGKLLDTVAKRLPARTRGP